MRSRWGVALGFVLGGAILVYLGVGALLVETCPEGGGGECQPTHPWWRSGGLLALGAGLLGFGLARLLRAWGGREGGDGEGGSGGGRGVQRRRTLR